MLKTKPPETGWLSAEITRYVAVYVAVGETRASARRRSARRAPPGCTTLLSSTRRPLASKTRTAPKLPSTGSSKRNDDLRAARPSGRRRAPGSCPRATRGRARPRGRRRVRRGPRRPRRGRACAGSPGLGPRVAAGLARVLALAATAAHDDDRAEAEQRDQRDEAGVARRPAIAAARLGLPEQRAGHAGVRACRPASGTFQSKTFVRLPLSVTCLGVTCSSSGCGGRATGSAPVRSTTFQLGVAPGFGVRRDLARARAVVVEVVGGRVAVDLDRPVAQQPRVGLAAGSPRPSRSCRVRLSSCRRSSKFRTWSLTPGRVRDDPVDHRAVVRVALVGLGGRHGERARAALPRAATARRRDMELPRRIGGGRDASRRAHRPRSAGGYRAAAGAGGPRSASAAAMSRPPRGSTRGARRRAPIRAGDRRGGGAVRLRASRARPSSPT